MPTIASLAAAPPALRSLSALVLPLVLVAAATLIVEPAGQLDPTIRGLLVYLPYVLLAAVIGLAMYFNRVRPLCAAVSLLFAYWLIRRHLQTSLDAPRPQAIYALIGVLVPLGLTLIAIVTERGVRHWHTARLALVTPALLLVGILLYGDDPARAQQLAGWFPAKPVSGYVLSWGASTSFAAALALILGFGLLSQERLESSLIGALLCVYSALAFFHVPLISTVMFATAAVILVAGLLQRSYAMAYRDELTGLLGRRALDERLAALGRRYTIALLDVDHFKQFNDTHGHKAGDEALKMVAARLSEVTGGGVPYRYGGEEFCVVFPRRGLDDCIDHLEALRRAIESYPLTLRDTAQRPDDDEQAARHRGEARSAEQVYLSASIGLAEPESERDTPEDVMKSADQALYAAKDAGRNRLGWFEAED
ncbi:MAG: GGDEF domain-containing protein [Halofilum sp. (in: g-proteobacteria)]|nr:GGDEF domain-containing protein [Halofilum sp. (in: g-proteobacteria)]